MSTRTLVILRHAKAANPEGTRDIDRPLTERGHADAAAAGAWLARRGYLPELVLCSPARRTRETWHGAALALAAAPAVQYEDDVYDAATETLLDLARDLPDEVTSVLLIGHNPGLSQLSALLDPEAADPGGLRTAGIAVHTLDGEWVEYGRRAAPLTVAHTARDA